MNIIAAWFATLAASAVIIAIFLSAYFKNVYHGQMVAAEKKARDYKRAYERERDAGVMLRQRYRALRAQHMGDGDEAMWYTVDLDIEEGDWPQDVRAFGPFAKYEDAQDFGNRTMQLFAVSPLESPYE